ncbi:SDR family NAD(P)-dependent oxidoreductase [Streptomyces goshikiensis]|uniref:SDR family NAD(P)-dependent oxidoreductase n=1 Tax=Streptomyces goshikiensis TaxID=1942 RepID=UPI003669B76B
MSKIWFITGASRGLGRDFAEAAVAQGDKVVATEWAGPSLAVAEMIPAYDPARIAGQEFAKTIVPGDPAAAARGVVEVANAENPPLRVFLGNAGLDWLPGIYADRLKTWGEWADLSHRALK